MALRRMHETRCGLDWSPVPKLLVSKKIKPRSANNAKYGTNGNSGAETIEQLQKLVRSCWPFERLLYIFLWTWLGVHVNLCTCEPVELFWDARETMNMWTTEPIFGSCEFTSLWTYFGVPVAALRSLGCCWCPSDAPNALAPWRAHRAVRTSYDGAVYGGGVSTRSALIVTADSEQLYISIAQSPDDDDVVFPPQEGFSTTNTYVDGIN